MKILVVRPDRIGDVVLSTPVLEAIKCHYPSHEVDLLVREAVLPVVEHNPYISKVIVYRPAASHSGVTGFWRLVRQLFRERYDVAITLQADLFVSSAIFAAGIRHRIGPYSKWFSFVLFNRGRRQSRSSVEMHETDYNLMLLRKLGIRAPTRQFEPKVVPNENALERMKKFLRESGALEGVPFVAVHPGMGGSALNWPEEYYVELIQRLAARGINVIVTGSKAEKPLVERVVKAARAQESTRPVYPFLGENTYAGLQDMIALLSMAQVVVAPSTGPLHLASALGRRTVSFYPPIRVQSALRWGPYATASTEGRHTVLVPDALCGQDFKCAGSRCHFYFCMERVGVEEALQSVIQQLESAQ